jgi:hypothetical protein
MSDDMGECSLKLYRTVTIGPASGGSYMRSDVVERRASYAMGGDIEEGPSGAFTAQQRVGPLC